MREAGGKYVVTAVRGRRREDRGAVKKGGDRGTVQVK